MTGGGLSAASAGGTGGDPASGRRPLIIDERRPFARSSCAEIKVALVIFGGPFKSLAVLNSHLWHHERARHENFKS